MGRVTKGSKGLRSVSDKLIKQHILLPCVAVAYFDHESEMGYRCSTCFAMVGSIGQPDECQKEMEKYKTLEAIGGKGWDYDLGEQKE